MLLLAASFSDVTFHAHPGESSVFPLALALALFGLRSDYSKNATVLVFLALALGVAYGWAGGASVESAAQAGIAYIQLIVVGAYYLKWGWTGPLSVPVGILSFHLIIGFMQYSEFASDSLAYFLGLLLPRSSAVALSDIGRGISFVSTEPSHALQSILLPMYLVAVEGDLRMRWLAAFSFLATVFFAGAGVGYVYLMVAILFASIRRPILAIVSSMVIALVVSSVLEKDSRIISLALSFFAIFDDWSWDAFLMATSLSGFRLPSVLAAYSSLLYLPSWVGFGMWDVSSLEFISRLGYDVENLGHWRYTGELTSIKPYSPVANLILDFWWAGLVAPVLLVSKPLATVLCSKASRNVVADALLCVGVFGVFFLVTVGKPAFVATICMAEYFRRQRKS
ncbi:hypothetical protein [Aquabacterium olei]|uniref:hypothetical protein n=1 Tax=Aquabacterium olei TaxID=1296669 RepID=UPI00131ED502|nr:hypothetical protein [Aquabacterium olei]